MNSTYKDPHYAGFSNLLLLSVSYVQILPSVPNFETTLITIYPTAEATESSETSVHFYQTIRC